jgi:hypothetical protein
MAVLSAIDLIAHGEKCGVAHQRADVELAPAGAELVLVFAA